MGEKKFDSTKIEPFLKKYNEYTNNDTLSDLFESTVFIIDTVLFSFMRRFSKKHPSDYEDICQQVYIGVFKLMPKVVILSKGDSDAFISLLIVAITYSFKSAYAKYKKAPIFIGGVYSQFVSWSPDTKDVPIIFSIDASATPHTDAVCYIESTFNYDPLIIYTFEKLQHDLILLNQFKQKLLERVYLLNRFKDKTSIIRFCLEAFLTGRSPSSTVISRMWKVPNCTFWPKYTHLLLRSSFMSTYKEFHV